MYDTGMAGRGETNEGWPNIVPSVGWSTEGAVCVLHTQSLLHMDMEMLGYKRETVNVRESIVWSVCC